MGSGRAWTWKFWPVQLSRLIFILHRSLHLPKFSTGFYPAHMKIFRFRFFFSLICLLFNFFSPTTQNFLIYSWNLFYTKRNKICRHGYWNDLELKSISFFNKYLKFKTYLQLKKKKKSFQITWKKIHIYSRNKWKLHKSKMLD